jgi:hypothetical protein
VQFTSIDVSDGLAHTYQQFIYRLWSGDNCLYIGQHRGFHPLTRIGDHASEKDWWPDVNRIEYAVVGGDLDGIEQQQIAELLPKHNVTWNPGSEAARASYASRRGPQGSGPRYSSGIYNPAEVINISMTVDEDDWAAFGDLAKERDSNRSWLLRQFIRAQVAKAAG